MWSVLPRTSCLIEGSCSFDLFARQLRYTTDANLPFTRSVASSRSTCWLNGIRITLVDNTVDVLLWYNRESRYLHKHSSIKHLKHSHFYVDEYIQAIYTQFPHLPPSKNQTNICGSFCATVKLTFIKLPRFKHGTFHTSTLFHANTVSVIRITYHIPRTTRFLTCVKNMLRMRYLHYVLYPDTTTTRRH